VDQFKVHPFLTPRFHPPSPVPPLTPIPPPPTLTCYCWLLDQLIYKFAYYGSPIGISTHPLITSLMSPNVNRPIMNHFNALGSLSHIIYKYSDKSDPYCLIVFYFSLTVPFCIPFWFLVFVSSHLTHLTPMSLPNLFLLFSSPFDADQSSDNYN